MKMMERLLFWLSGFLPMRIINDGKRQYLERYYVGTLLGWRFYLHRFVGSDPDRGLHDHPWTKAHSIILSGWYWEETRSGMRKVRWFNSLTGDTFHRVVLPPLGPIRPSEWETYRPQPCWTLFFHRVGRAKKWGFLKEQPDGTWLYVPHDYKREGNQEEWWLTAPRRGAA